MVDPRATRRIAFRLAFAAMAALIVFVQILPFRLGAGGLPAPDLLILFCFAWALRRPDYVPVALIGAVLLAADILLMRPIGLWAALGVIAVECLRGRGHGSAELHFPVEWILVGAVLGLMSVVQVAVLGILAVPQPPLGDTALHYVITVAAYPLVVLATTFGFGVRPATPAERDAMAWHR